MSNVTNPVDKDLPQSVLAVDNVYAYLRVSTDQQDVDNQKLGVLEYCAKHGFSAPIIVEDTVSGRKEWRERRLGQLMVAMPSGSVFVVAEISRLARSTLQVLEILQAANDKNINVHIVKSGMIFDGSMQSKITSTMLGLLAEIERDFITMRTSEALRALKAKGVKLGRPQKPQETLTLDKHKLDIQKYIKLKVTKRNIAKIVGCSPNTLYSWMERREEWLTDEALSEVKA